MKHITKLKVNKIEKALIDDRECVLIAKDSEEFCYFDAGKTKDGKHMVYYTDNMIENVIARICSESPITIDTDEEMV